MKCTLNIDQVLNNNLPPTNLTLTTLVPIYQTLEIGENCEQCLRTAPYFLLVSYLISSVPTVTAIYYAHNVVQRESKNKQMSNYYVPTIIWACSVQPCNTFDANQWT